MNELALFAGGGGGILGGILCGFRTVCAVEIDPAARNVLLARQDDRCLPPFPIWDDIRSFDGRPWRGLVEVVTGGFPCQAYSGASRGRANASDLWPEMLRVVADVSARYVFAENVQRKAIDRAGDDLEALGYKTLAVALGAADLGGDHLRKRYWLLAYADSDGELPLRFDAEVAWLPSVRPSVWETYPDESRVADGVAVGMDGDRLRITGNGQLPIVAAAAWSHLLAARCRLNESNDQCAGTDASEKKL